MKYLLDDNAVRLIGSPVQHMGRVEIFDRRSNQWGTICADDVYSRPYDVARIICKSLGYSSYRNYGRASDSSNITLSSNSPIVNGRFRCTYTYTDVYQNLYQCSDFESHLGVSPSRCTSDQEWIVFCTRKFSIMSEGTTYVILNLFNTKIFHPKRYLISL